MLEASVILAILCRELKLSLRPGFSPEPRLRATLRPAPGMPMRVESLP